MKIQILIVSLVTLLVLGCQNSQQDSNSIVEELTSSSSELDTPNVQTENNFVLPTYGSNKPREDNAIVTEYGARSSGRLTIIDGCVTLTYPKDRYPNKTSPDNFSRMPIFPGGSKFNKDGQTINVNGKNYKDGDYVEMGGRGTIREFWTSFSSDMPYIPVPDHCKADEYWEVGGTGLRLMD